VPESQVIDSMYRESSVSDAHKEMFLTYAGPHNSDFSSRWRKRLAGAMKERRESGEDKREFAEQLMRD
jgi:hypothetical protein